jgi:glycosyltransferase involved in cell wall biosynthesis
LTANLGLAARVEFAGFVENIEDVWAAHHVLTLPSRYEGLPIATVEAMLCGRPVIVTDVGGHSEVIEDGATGFLAKAATVDAFRNALEEAWQRRFDLRRMGELAAMRSRQLIPEDPIKVFSERIMKICGARGSDRDGSRGLRPLNRHCSPSRPARQFFGPETSRFALKALISNGRVVLGGG